MSRLLLFLFFKRENCLNVCFFVFCCYPLYDWWGLITVGKYMWAISFINWCRGAENFKKKKKRQWDDTQKY